MSKNSNRCRASELRCSKYSCLKYWAKINLSLQDSAAWHRVLSASGRVVLRQCIIIINFPESHQSQFTTTIPSANCYCTLFSYTSLLRSVFYGYALLELFNMPADIRNFFGGKPQSATPIRPKKEEKKKNSKLFGNLPNSNCKL